MDDESDLLIFVQHDSDKHKQPRSSLDICSDLASIIYITLNGTLIFLSLRDNCKLCQRPVLRVYVNDYSALFNFNELLSTSSISLVALVLKCFITDQHHGIYEDSVHVAC